MVDSTPAAPAGWYPAGVEAQERYWNGAEWTDHVRPIAAAAPEAPTVAFDAAQTGAAGGMSTAEFPTAVLAPAPAGFSQPLGVAGASAVTPGSEKAPWFKRKAVIIPAAALAGIIVISSIASAVAGGNGKSETQAPPPVVAADDETVAVPDVAGLTAKEAQALLENAGLEVEFSADEGVVLDRDNWTVLSTVPAAGETAQAGNTVVVNVEKTAENIAAEPEEPEPSTPAEPEAPAEPEMTLAQENAVESAESYLSFMAFSRAGLTQQLTSEYGEGFDAADAEFAIAYLEQNGLVDWNAEAVESAESYLELTSFSRDGLFEQLTSEYGEGFTADQANHALAAVGY